LAYLKNGVNIRNIAEIAPTSDPRNASDFSSSKYLFNGKTHEAHYGTKMIMNYDGYMYSNEAGIKNSFRRNGSAYFAVSARGHRPCPTYSRRKWQSSTAGTYYVNKFLDGEVWISTTYNSRTGTRISTTTEDIHFLFVLLVGSGGGGGGGNGTKAGGGGWFYGHNGGAGGNNGGNGSSGGIGAGGGGGAWAVFAGGSGASGGNGYAAVFY